MSNKEDNTFNKEEWINQKKEDRKKAFAMLNDATEELNNSDCLMNYLDVQSRFDRYSVSNAILVAYQLPEANKLEDSKTWHDSGAYIQKGERAILILEPGKEFRKENGDTGVLYNAKKVFDISQTDREYVPKVTKKYNEKYLVKFLVKDSYMQVEINASLPEGTDVKFNEEKKTIYVRPGMNGEKMFRNLSKEIAFLGLEKNNPGREDNELIAASVSYMVCRRFNVEPEKIPEGNKLFKNKNSKEIRSELNDARFEVNKMTLSIEKAFEALNRNRDCR